MTPFTHDSAGLVNCPLNTHVDSLADGFQAA